MGRDWTLAFRGRCWDPRGQYFHQPRRRWRAMWDHPAVTLPGPGNDPFLAGERRGAWVGWHSDPSSHHLAQQGGHSQFRISLD